MHEGEEVSPHLAAVGVAGEDFLWVTGIDRDFPLAGVIAGAPEWAVESNLAAAAVHLDRHAALRRSFLERSLGLEVIDAAVLGIAHSSKGKKRGPMVSSHPPDVHPSQFVVA